MFAGLDRSSIDPEDGSLQGRVHLWYSSFILEIGDSMCWELVFYVSNVGALKSNLIHLDLPNLQIDSKWVPKKRIILFEYFWTMYCCLDPLQNRVSKHDAKKHINEHVNMSPEHGMYKWDFKWVINGIKWFHMNRLLMAMLGMFAKATRPS